jgi:hypothetical protein
MELGERLLTVRACRVGTAKASTLARVKKPNVMVFTSFMMRIKILGIMLSGSYEK